MPQRPTSLTSTLVNDLRTNDISFAPRLMTLDAKALDDYRDIWSIELDHRLTTLGLVGQSESDEWDWTELANYSPQHRSYALWRDKMELLALLCLKEDGHWERGEWLDAGPCPELGDALYVEYLDTAPTVQGRLLLPDETRPYSSLLPALIAACELRSKKVGHDGRIVLHAIAGAVPAYLKAGMIKVGMEGFAEGGYLLMRNTVGWELI